VPRRIRQYSFTYDCAPVWVIVCNCMWVGRRNYKETRFSMSRRFNQFNRKAGERSKVLAS
jgi:hypothetical protein